MLTCYKEQKKNGTSGEYYKSNGELDDYINQNIGDVDEIEKVMKTDISLANADNLPNSIYSFKDNMVYRGDKWASLAAVLDNQGLLSKPFQMEGASEGTSLASKYGSKLMPWEMSKRLPTHFRNGTLRYTKVFGRFLGRMVGPVGWAILTYDIGMTLYNTQTIYNGFVNGK